jgi:hypothetical protein
MELTALGSLAGGTRSRDDLVVTPTGAAGGVARRVTGRTGTDGIRETRFWAAGILSTLWCLGELMNGREVAAPAIAMGMAGIALATELSRKSLPAFWARRTERRRAQAVQSLARTRAGSLVSVEGTIEPLVGTFDAAASGRPAVLARYRAGRPGSGGFDEVHAVPFALRLASGERLLVDAAALDVTDTPAPAEVRSAAGLAALRLTRRSARRPARVGETVYGPGDVVELVGELRLEPSPHGAGHPGRGTPMAATLRPGPLGRVLARRAVTRPSR